MATIEEILACYDQDIGLYRDFCSRVESLLQSLISEAGLKPHSITSRIKDRESLQKKVHRKEAEYASLNSITDIAGIRVTTYFSAEVDTLAEVIAREFEVDIENSVDKRRTLDPDRFGYLSLHYVARLNSSRRALPEYIRFEKLKIEIQIRSILQHAWAEIEHDLGYKSAVAIPREVRRQFARLAGLLELADEQFMAIRDSLSLYKAEVGSRIAEEPAKVTINRDSLAEYLKQTSLPQRIDKYIAESLHSEGIYWDLEGLSREVERLTFLGIESIAQLDRALENNEPAIMALARYYGSESEPDSEEDTPLLAAGISIFYLCYILLLQDKDTTRLVEYLERFNIGLPGQMQGPEEIAEELSSWHKGLK